MSEGSGNLLLSGEMTVEKASRFLDECAVYFERRPTGGEDSAYWANVYNAEWCRKISAYIAGTEQKLRTTSLEALAISDTNNELQARLSEAVKVLEAYLNEYEGVYDMAATKERPAYRSDGAKAAEDAARKFLATIGEET